MIGGLEGCAVLHQVDPALARQRDLIDAGLLRRGESEHAAVPRLVAVTFLLGRRQRIGDLGDGDKRQRERLLLQRPTRRARGNLFQGRAIEGGALLVERPLERLAAARHALLRRTVLGRILGGHVLREGAARAQQDRYCEERAAPFNRPQP